MRFCLDCDSLLIKIFVNGNDTARFPLDEEKQKIAEYIYKEYKESRSKVGDLELDLLNSVKVDTASGRFDIVFLATLFSAWAMKEERDYSIWTNLMTDFREIDTSLYDYILSANESQRKHLAQKYMIPQKCMSNIVKTARKLQPYNGDINGLVDENSWFQTLENIRDKCKGVEQKAFWIARVMRQKNAWDIPGKYCCVSDSHNKALLKNAGFIRSDDDLYYNSLVMWKYFNENFENKYYDLPVFRFARNHGCNKCEIKCNLSILSKCS